MPTHNITLNTTENFSYSLILRSCETSPCIEATFTGLSSGQISPAIAEAIYGFRHVEVVCEQTGEVVYTNYKSSELFTTLLSYGDCLDRVHAVVYGD